MIPALLQAATSLLASSEAARLYGPDHAITSTKSNGAAEAFAAALRDHPSIFFIAVEGRLSIAAGADFSEAPRLDALAALMTSAGIGWIGCDRPPNAHEFAALSAAFLSRSPLPPGGALRIGSLGCELPAAPGIGASNTAAPTDAENLVSLARPLGGVFRGDEPAAAISQDQLAPLVHMISKAIRAGKDALLPVASLKTHDEYTYIHAVNVAIMSASLAESVGLSASRTREVLLGGLLHDIGKRVIPKEILSKTGALTPEERTITETHPVEGARIILEQGNMPDIVPVIAFEHHLFADGTGGYPKMPDRHRPTLVGQIVRVADTFDALCTHRPYRAALTSFQASQIMYSQTGTSFDSELVDLFFRKIVSRLPPPSSVLRAA